MIVSFYALVLSMIIGAEDALIRCVAWGGDADTIGCIVGSMLGARYGGSWLPDRWVSKVEDASMIIEMGKLFSKLTVDRN